MRWYISKLACNRSCFPSSGFERGERGGDTLIIDRSSEIPLAARIILVTVHL